MSEPIAYTFLESPWCELTLASSSRGLCLVGFGHSLAKARASLDGFWGEAEWTESKSAHREVLAQLRAYFRGQRRRFALPLDLRGTRFQLRLWQALRRIPFGQTRSYGELARAAGQSRAFRAAGMACHSNRLAIVVPCHRVVGSDGHLSGFGGGLGLKRRLLEHEGVELK